MREKLLTMIVVTWQKNSQETLSDSWSHK